jgi:ribonuclease HI
MSSVIQSFSILDLPLLFGVVGFTGYSDARVTFVRGFLIIRQSGYFTMLWQHFDHETSIRMELRAATEALRYAPEGMTVWATPDSQYVRKRVVEWMPKWKRNGWENSKKQGVANAIL